MIHRARALTSVGIFLLVAACGADDAEPETIESAGAPGTSALPPAGGNAGSGGVASVPTAGTGGALGQAGGVMPGGSGGVSSVAANGALEAVSGQAGTGNNPLGAATAAGTGGAPVISADAAGASNGGVGGGTGGVETGNAGSSVLDETASAGTATGGSGSGDAGTAGVAGSGAGGAGVAGADSGDAGMSAGGTSGASGGGSAMGGSSGMDENGGAGGQVEGEPTIRMVGRFVDSGNGAKRFSWSGTNFHARFSGTQVSMDIDDGNNQNRFTVVIDNGSPATVTTVSGQSTLTLATGLSDGTHELLVWRNTEATGGASEFLGLSGFSDGGELLAPALAPDRRIEVIGDSLSAGAGAEGTTNDCTPGIDAFTNDYQAYGSVAARTVGADLVTIAWSGIGVYRNSSGSGPTMPQRYDYAEPNEQSAWDFSEYQPHVVVLNLGTNDFGSGNPGQAYVTAYVQFIEHVRSLYTDAPFVLIDMYGGERATAIQSVISSLNGSGENNVEMVSFSSVPNNNTACNQHPGTSAQQAMGDILSARLQALMNW